jgi:hypothetical protein
MSNELQLLRADAIELLESADTNNLGEASKTGNKKIAVIGNQLYIVDPDGVAAMAGLNATVAAGATKTLTVVDHNGKTIKLDTAAGSIVILPPATGSGAKIRFVVTVIATSNSHIVKVANANDTIYGLIEVLTDDSANVIGFKASSTDDTITLNRSTTGSTALGEWLELEDIASGKWAVRGVIAATGTEVTPFSATVS